MQIAVWKRSLACLAALIVFGVAATRAQTGKGCTTVQGTMTESRTTTGCRDGRKSCFVGELAADQGLRGTTYFHGDGSGTPASTSPAFTPYGGFFEYATPKGTIALREAGIVSAADGVVTAFQKITGGTGAYAGATGHFYVFGTTRDDRVVTRLHGEICAP